MTTLKLWKWDKVIGIWKIARSVTEETAAEWLKIWQKDEPDEFFLVAIRRPTRKPDRSFPS